MEWIEIRVWNRRTWLHQSVSTLVVEWIEMVHLGGRTWRTWVSTLVVEWIEIAAGIISACHGRVSTLVVEWIEIL